MAPSARARIVLVRPDNSAYDGWRWRNTCGHIDRAAGYLEPLALIEGGGILVRDRRTGILSEWLGDRIRSIHPRKAEAALAALEGVIDVPDR